MGAEDWLSKKITTKSSGRYSSTSTKVYPFWWKLMFNSSFSSFEERLKWVEKLFKDCKGFTKPTTKKNSVVEERVLIEMNFYEADASSKRKAIGKFLEWYTYDNNSKHFDYSGYKQPSKSRIGWEMVFSEKLVSAHAKDKSEKSSTKREETTHFDTELYMIFLFGFNQKTCDASHHKWLDKLDFSANGSTAQKKDELKRDFLKAIYDESSKIGFGCGDKQLRKELMYEHESRRRSVSSKHMIVEYLLNVKIDVRKHLNKSVDDQKLRTEAAKQLKITLSDDYRRADTTRSNKRSGRSRGHNRSDRGYSRERSSHRSRRDNRRRGYSSESRRFSRSAD